MTITHRRRVSPGLLRGWIITDGEGQHTAHINGSRTQALTRARRQLDDVGGGELLVDEDEDM
ncbi:hypothetical protein [Salinifilum ghardaiensis]